MVFTALLRQRSQPRLVIGCALRLPDLAGGERPAVAPVAAVAAGRQRPELARRGVEPLLVPLGPLGPPWLGIGVGIGVGVGVGLGLGVGVRLGVRLGVGLGVGLGLGFEG